MEEIATLHRTEEETQWTKGFCANVRIWVRIPRTHIKPDAVVFPVIFTLQLRHRRERKKEESSEVCGPASLALSEQKTVSHMVEGEDLSSEVAL